MNKETVTFKTNLNSFQLICYEIIKWLIRDEPRGSGRTFLLALAFIEKAFNNIGESVKIYDHIPNHYTEIMNVIESMFNDQFLNSGYRLEINHKNKTIKIKK